jgi:hypothetical protein
LAGGERHTTTVGNLRDFECNEDFELNGLELADDCRMHSESNRMPAQQPVASLYDGRRSRRQRPMLDKVLDDHSRERDPEFTHRLVRMFLSSIVQTDAMLRRNERRR